MKWLLYDEWERLEGIENVYDKAETDETAAALLKQMEIDALEEVREMSDCFPYKRRKLTKEEYDQLPLSIKSEHLYFAGMKGLASIASAPTAPEIGVSLSPEFIQAPCCTAFQILWHLQRMDGVADVLHARCRMVIHAPHGSKEGLDQFLRLVAILYPWLETKVECFSD